MILKLRVGRWRLTMTFAPVIDVVGVNSLLPDGNHILMWDFDGVELKYITMALGMIQEDYALPNIYILQTHQSGNYIAYCFARCEWQDAVEIVAATPFVCYNFFKWGVFRKRFTLRVGPKCGRVPKLVKVIKSPIPEGATIPDLKSWVKYETLQDGYTPNIIKLGERS